MKRTREYLRFLTKAIDAIEASIGAFNSVRNPYKVETSLLLMANGWELLAKSVLVKNRKDITKDKQGNTVTGEVAVSRLRGLELLDDNQEDCVQQIISLRNFAAHNVLPFVPEEILHHLFFFSCKFFKGIVEKVYPSHAKQLTGNYLSLAFGDLTTYAEKVQKLVSRIKRNAQDKELVWLLERGIKFDGVHYISQETFEEQYRRKQRIMPHLSLGGFIRTTEMVRIVPVQAPRNYTADIKLRKGKGANSSLPVVIKRTDIEDDYPHLTTELAQIVGLNASFASATIKYLGLKGDDRYHQPVRASQAGIVHRYSQAAIEKVQNYLKQNPGFNPYEKLKAKTQQLHRLTANPTTTPQRP
jgi:hypothetical protein